MAVQQWAVVPEREECTDAGLCLAGARAQANLTAVMGQKCPTDFSGTKRITLTSGPTLGESSESLIAIFVGSF